MAHYDLKPRPSFLHNEMNEPMLDKKNSIFAAVIIVMLMGLLAHSCVDAIVRTVESEEEQRIYKVDYDKPAAYRMSSPTPEQMDKYHDLLRVMEVKNAKMP